MAGLQDEVDDLRLDVDRVRRVAAGTQAGTAGLQTQVDEIALAAGLVAVTGPGVEVSLDDSSLEESPSGNINDLVIHSQDVQAVVNSLWRSGAEAMSINGQRLVSTSAVLCVGNTLLLNGTVHSPPYVVRAIGARARRVRQRSGDAPPARRCRRLRPAVLRAPGRPAPAARVRRRSRRRARHTSHALAQFAHNPLVSSGLCANSERGVADSVSVVAPRVLVIDNYDSFVYNLVQYLGELGADPVVHRHDAITVDQIGDLAPDLILVSPGPGRPEDAGVSNEVITELGSVDTDPRRVPWPPVHRPGLRRRRGAGAGDHARQDVAGAPRGRRRARRACPQPFEATRYHSLVVSPDTLPDVLEVTAHTDDGVIMGLRHRRHPIEGVQFHPESILTTAGHRLLENWLRAAVRT